MKKIKILLFAISVLTTSTLLAQNNKSELKKTRKNADVSQSYNFDLTYLQKTGEDDFDLDAFQIGTGKNFLLIIAVDKYRYWKSLQNPIKDAQDIKKMLQAKYTFEPKNTYELYNEQVTPQNLHEIFEKIKEKGSNIDNLMIYYSGHGYYDPSFDEGYWIPFNGKNGAVASYIPNTSIRNYIKSMKFRHVFLVADACFSGALFADSHRGGYVDKMEQIQSRWGLSSGNLEYVSDGKEGENSPFAHYVLKFLKENLKDKFAVSEMIQYVKTAVADNTEQTPVGNPLRGVGNEGGEFVFRTR